MSRAIHDMGGNEAFFGPVEPEADEPVFHARWEARVFGMAMYVGATVDQNLDAFRDVMERLDPREYLASYYGRWFAALEQRLVTADYLGADEVDARVEGRPEAGSHRRPPRLRIAVMKAAVKRVFRPMNGLFLRLYPRVQGYHRRASSAPRFAEGDVVRVRATRPDGHTRLPGYVCGRRGTIRRLHGPMVFPDAHARREGEQPQHMYTVAFAADELWGEGAEKTVTVHVDLFESYMEGPG